MPKTVSSQTVQTVVRLTSAAIVTLSLWAGSVLAKDPFRTTHSCQPIQAKGGHIEHRRNSFRSVN